MFTKLLVPLDNSRLSEQALPAAQSIAKAAGASMELVYVHQPQPFDGYADAPWNGARRSSEESYVCAIADEIRMGTNVPIEGRLATGGAADGICARAVEAAVDLIVMTTHGRTGISRAWVGSIADAVVRQATVPVLLLRPTEKADGVGTTCPTFKRILVPLDGSAASESTLAPAVSLARAGKGRVVIVEVVPPIPMVLPDVTVAYGMAPTIMDVEATEEFVEAATARLRTTAAQLAQAGIEVETYTIVSEFPAQAILDAARAHAVDVIAMATSGRGASRVVVGSVTDKVMRSSELPLLLMRPHAVQVQERVASISEERLAGADA